MHTHDRSDWTPDQRAQTCAIGPSPELKEKWDKELSRTLGRKRDVAAPVFGLEPEPTHLGFNDGVIMPPESFPAGTPMAAIRSAAALIAHRCAARSGWPWCSSTSPTSTMTATKQHFQDLFFSSGVLPHGSVKEYYSEVTNGLITLDGTVVGPYRMPQTLAWYANNGSGIGKNGTAFRSPTLAHDAAVASDAAINFGPYDNDGNGFVDAFIVVHAGSGAEQTGSLGDIWSHKSTMASAYNTDGTKIYGYLTIPEDAKIGVSAHELGHLLFGFPDLYDTDYSSEGIGNWCLMSGGSWNGGGDIPAHPQCLVQGQPGVGHGHQRDHQRPADDARRGEQPLVLPALEERWQRVGVLPAREPPTRRATTPGCPAVACSCGTSTRPSPGTPTRTTTRWGCSRPTATGTWSSTTTAVTPATPSPVPRGRTPSRRAPRRTRSRTPAPTPASR